MRAEDEVLIQCARSRLCARHAERLALLLGGVLDWDYLTGAAGRHGLRPLLYWHLSATAPEAVPAQVLDVLRERFGENSLRNLALAGELRRILRLLREHGIVGVPYKGPLLASAVYGNLALREFADLDILIQKRDVPRAKALLAREYRPEPQLTPAQEAAYLEFDREYKFVHPDGDYVVELQWGFTAMYYAVGVELEELWQRLETSTLGGQEIQILSTEDLLLVLCVHGYQHVWERLEWICGVAELIRSQTRMDWQQVLRLARRTGTERILLLGLILASDLLGAPLPAGIHHQAVSDGAVRRLASRVYARLFAETGPERRTSEESRFTVFHLQARERLRDRARYCLRSAVAPGLHEWRLAALPAPLFPLYYLLRPLRLGVKYGARLARRARGRGHLVRQV